MSRRDYPRIVESFRPYTGPVQNKCGVDGCDSMPVGVQCVQFTFMRGEDEFIVLCEQHKKEIRTNVREFCERNNFREGAWK